MIACRLHEYDEDVKKGFIREIEITNPFLKNRLSANICDTIRMEIPEGKKYFHAYYTIKVNPHKLAKPKNIKSNLLCGKDEFHRAAVSSINLYFANHHQKKCEWVPIGIVEDWLRLWDDGEITSKDDLHGLYDKWRPDNLIIYPSIYERNGI